MSISALPWDFAIILLALAIAVPWRGVTRARALFSRSAISSADRKNLYLSTILLQWLAAGLTGWRATARGLTAMNLGTALPHLTSAAGLGLIMASLLGSIQLMGFRAVAKIPRERRGRVYELACRIRPQNGTETILFLILLSTVSLCEEFLYRGFVFAVFRRFPWPSAAAAILASSAFFAVAHLYQGRRGIFLTFVLGVIFSAARSFSGSLAPAVIAHFAVDAVAGLGAPKAGDDIN